MTFEFVAVNDASAASSTKTVRVNLKEATQNSDQGLLDRLIPLTIRSAVGCYIHYRNPAAYTIMPKYITSST